METIQARNVVLGAGAMGCATAYQLARRGEEVLLVEQFERMNTQGSSHGAARITRHSYADPRYARLMIPAFAEWRALEADAGRTLYLKTGGVSLCDQRVDYVTQVIASLRELEIPHRRLTSAELRRAMPAFEVPETTDAVFEPDAGIVLADTTRGVELDLADHHGGDRFQFLENCPITSVDLEGSRPVLVGHNRRIEADFLIITAGAWIARLFPTWAQGLKVTRQQVTYLRPAQPSPFEIGRFPVFVYKGMGDESPDGASFYGMPRVLDTWVKVARHSGPEFDPASADRPFDQNYIECVRHFCRWHLPALAHADVVQSEVCLYTEDQEENFRVGTYPGRPDVLVASPCSGHGFKFSPLIGRVLADLATTGETSVDITAWTYVP